MNRRTFLAAIGAAATQQKFGPAPTDVQVLDECEPPPPPPVITVSRFPYVQNVQNDRASILWATFEPGIGQVRYSSDGVNFKFVTAGARFFGRGETRLPFDFFQYQADLTGLEPNTDYVYSVTVDDQDVGSAGETRFRTAGPGPFKFIVFGDSGWGGIEQGQIAQRIAAEKPAMVIHTGDLVYPVGSYEYYQRNYFNFYGPTMSSVPFFPCLGNHDYDVPFVNGEAYLSIHSLPSEGVPAADRGRYYSYDWGNVHFISLDAHQALSAAVNAGGGMLRWLENDLRTTHQFWRIVYFHYPPHATGINVNDPPSALVRQHIIPIMENNGVQLVFSGHEHSYQRSVPMRRSNTVADGVGTHYFTSGGGGAIRYPVPLPKTVVKVAKSEYHYTRIDVQGTNLVVRSIRFDGSELDNITIAPTPAFSDEPRVTPVVLTPGPVPGATIRILGRGLAAEENFVCGPAQSVVAGTVVTVNGVPVRLLYVSPTQIYAQLPFAVEGNMTLRVTTPNGFTERSI
jgi:hypothetical protein